MKKVFWMDIETTGIDNKKCDIIHLAYILELDGACVEHGCLKFRPLNFANVEQGACDVHGITIEEMMTYPPAEESYFALVKMLNKHINKYDKSDKAHPAGYNIMAFDYPFLVELPRKLGIKYGVGSYLNHCTMDPYPLVNILLAEGLISPMENRKLATVCHHFGIGIKAHDAYSDIKATRELYKRLLGRLIYADKELNDKQSVEKRSDDSAVGCEGQETNVVNQGEPVREVRKMDGGDGAGSTSHCGQGESVNSMAAR
jgi:DNA polymerase III epsilon subunit-like protein